MEFFSCNDCAYIDYTEEQQHYIGIKTIPDHHCNFYKERVIHGNHHMGKDLFIKPCERCRFEKHRNFLSREFIQFVRESCKYKLSEFQWNLLIEYFKATNTGEKIIACFPRMYGRNDIERIIREWEKLKTDGTIVQTGIKQDRE